MRKHALLILAFALAPVFWLFFYLWIGKIADLHWPLIFPKEFLVKVLVFPILEEVVFRKFLQGRLHSTSWGKNHRHGISNANLITSLVFSCFHLVSHSWLWAAAVVIPSLVFGFFRDRYRQIKPCIALHIFYNAGYFWLFGHS